MPILMPKDTADALGENAKNCTSRSLLLDRFVYDHPDMDEARKLHFAQVCMESVGAIRAARYAWQKTLSDSKAKPAEQAEARRFLDDTAGLATRTTDVGAVSTKDAAGQERSPKAVAYAAWLATLRDIQFLHAQLQSRLLINMAGGVMENAGLCLDRFGLPYLPGSAVKGCARRAALAALREWCETGQKPGATEADKDNLFKTACDPFTTQAEMLAAIARVFGWCEQDWSDKRGHDGRFISDFAWACSGATAAPAPTGRAMPAQGSALGSPPTTNPSPEGAAQTWPTLRNTTARQLARKLGVGLPDDDATPWKRLPNFAGSVSFLPAYPVDLGKTPGPVEGLPLPVPELGKLELDVVTCHHGKYYAEPDRAEKPREWEEWNRQWGTAPDTEEPVPVVFPAVAPGHIFTFALAPLRRGSAGNPPAPSNPCAHAHTWLKIGLETFGLGAKTNVGYGWFDTGDKVQDGVLAALQRASLKPSQALRDEFLKWDDKQVRRAATAFAFAALAPKTGREATDEYKFTLAKFILDERTALFLAQKNHAGSEFAKGVKRLAEEFQLPLP